MVIVSGVSSVPHQKHFIPYFWIRRNRLRRKSLELGRLCRRGELAPIQDAGGFGIVWIVMNYKVVC